MKTKRHSVFPTYLQGYDNYASPCFRCAVAPGESMTSLTAKLRLQTASMTKLAMNTAFAEIEFYYVPLRILWADFPDWIMGTNEQSAGLTFPAIQTATDNDFFGQHNAVSQHGSMSAMPDRAWKLIYNEYYLDELRTNKFDHTDDSWNAGVLPTFGFGGIERTLKKVLHLDEETFNITVDSGSHAGEISIQALLVAMREQKRKKNVEFTGDLYVDMLRSMGVKASSNILQRPEHLGGVRKYMKPRTIRRTDGTSGAGASYFDSEISLKIGGGKGSNKFFTEHGLVIGVMRYVPQAFIETKHAPLDAYMVNREDFYHPDIARDRGFETVNAGDWLGVGSSEVALTPWAHYHEGEEFTNVDFSDIDNVSLTRTYQPTDVGKTIQPDNSEFETVYRTGEITHADGSNAHWAAQGIIRYGSNTPVPKGKAAL